jgi:hypothetical protein
VNVRDFLEEVRRLTPLSDSSGNRVAELVDAARVSAVAELIRAFGPGLLRAEPLGVQMTVAFPVEVGGEDGSIGTMVLSFAIERESHG